tara:strand:+ start:99 stop:1265 length:1167 start_codon:yes stop_codon:yes gene_type:complete
MKKKIAILGSTGSIGKSTLKVIDKNRKNFDICFLSANNNYKELVRQAVKYKSKNILIKNKKFYQATKKLLKKSKTKVYTGDIPINKIISYKLDYTMSAIVGLAGLQPTIDSVKISKNLAIANKETIICGWEIISKLKKKFNTNILPVDSEHFSINELTKDVSNDQIEEIIITASGGPFLKMPLSKIKKVKPNQAIKHPNWRMGKKISVDSANLMNKVFEVIEAVKLFNFEKRKYKILIHPQSYIHSVINFKNGLTKMILYNPDMQIPISNTLYQKENKFFYKKKVDQKILDKMTFKKVNTKQFPSIKLVKKCLNLGPSTATIVNASNEVLVDLFLKGKIGFLDIVMSINKIFRDKEFKKYAKKKPKTVKDIKFIDEWARLKTRNMYVK